MQHLPDTPDLFEAVLLRVARGADKDPDALLRLACVCRSFAAFLRTRGGDAAWWQTAWTRFLGAQRCARLLEGPERPPTSGGVTARDKLRLAGSIGCLRCGRARVRKVYWEFRQRLCEPCMRSATVPSLFGALFVRLEDTLP